MSSPQFVDISSFQGAINFAAYVPWSKQWDGVSRIALKVTEGTTFTDPAFATNRAAALAAGVDSILYYHFSRPDTGNTAIAEADYMHSVVGNIRANDVIVLDYEVNSTLATATWAYSWLQRQEQNYGGKLPAIYAASAYIAAHLQYSGLARYPLWLANWTFDPNARPAAPAPWAMYQWLQYTDKATAIPGIATSVDCDVFVGGNAMTGIPQGWKDDGTTLTAPNGHKVVAGFRNYILNNTWDHNDVPCEEEHPATPIEVSNPGLGAGHVQHFNYSILEWTQARGVFLAYAGKEAMVLRQKLGV